MELPSWGCEDTACSPTLFPHFLSWPPTVATPVWGEEWEGGAFSPKLGFLLMYFLSFHLHTRNISS